LNRFDELRALLHGDEKKILERFLDEEQESIAGTIRDEIASDRQHVELVNYCAYAFTESGPARESGFVFIRVEPLFLPRTNPRFDLIIHNAEQNTSVMIECKSSISNPTETIKQISEAAEFARKNTQALEKEIGHHCVNHDYFLIRDDLFSINQSTP
jgi:hypothetical protein